MLTTSVTRLLGTAITTQPTITMISALIALSVHAVLAGDCASVCMDGLFNVFVYFLRTLYPTFRASQRVASLYCERWSHHA